jgi:hypothetical protein
MQNNFSRNLNLINRKLHIHIGLFLFLFIWLFSFSGLLLNHENWKFASFWEQRKETKKMTVIKVHNQTDSSKLLKDIITQLKLSGEVQNTQLNPDSVDFQIAYPGHVKNVHVDLHRGNCIERDIQFNVWGKLRTLHTFNGANKQKEDAAPNWLITRIWKFSMDAIAVGLILITISSWLMWYKVRMNYPFSALVLIVGFVISIYFVFLIRAM